MYEYTKIPVEFNEKLYKFPHEEVELKLKRGVLLLGIKVNFTLDLSSKTVKI